MTIILGQMPEPDVYIDHDSRLKRHTAAVRDNQITVAAILNHLLDEPPNASAAQEALEECDHQTQIDLWSHSTKAGGIWQTWQRDALKTGQLTQSYHTYRQRRGLPPLEIFP